MHLKGIERASKLASELPSTDVLPNAHNSEGWARPKQTLRTQSRLPVQVAGTT